MTTYNDAECLVHNIQWESSQIGAECPACKAEEDKRLAAKDAELATLRERVRVYENALNEIASWGEGEKVTGRFDEPHSAKKAREALGKAEK